MDRNQLLNDPETALRYALDGRQAQIWTAFPAIIQSVNLSAMTVSCVPAIKGVITDEAGSISYVTLPKLVDVPICFPSGGGFGLTLPLAANDEILVVIANRCIDAWWQSGGIQQPIELRMHDLSDAFAIPGPKSQPNVIPAISTTAVQLRNNAGTAFLGVTNAGILQLVNATGSMKTILQGMLTLLGNLETTLTTFATACEASTTDPTLVTAATALAASIVTLQTAITAYKNTTIPGIFQ